MFHHKLYAALSVSVLTLASLCYYSPFALAEEVTEDLRIRGKLQTRWQLNGSDSNGWSENLSVRRARIDGKWTPYDWVKLMLELEFTDGVEAKDLYAEFDVMKDLSITVGSFKKPFSRVRLMSPWELLIPERGLFDAQVTQRTRYGGFGARDVGLMLSGETLGPKLLDDPLKLKYDLGGFSSPPSADNPYRDLVGRAQLRVFKGLVVAFNSSYKIYQENSLQTAIIMGGDLKWEWDPFKLQVEGAWGDNVNTGGQLWGSHATLSYEIPLPQKLLLTPALMLEAFNEDASQATTLDWRLAAALNLDLNKQVRFVLSLDKTWENVGDSTGSNSNPLSLQLQNNLVF